MKVFESADEMWPASTYSSQKCQGMTMNCKTRNATCSTHGCETTPKRCASASRIAHHSSQALWRTNVFAYLLGQNRPPFNTTLFSVPDWQMKIELPVLPVKVFAVAAHEECML